MLIIPINKNIIQCINIDIFSFIEKIELFNKHIIIYVIKILFGFEYDVRYLLILTLIIYFSTDSHPIT